VDYMPARIGVNHLKNFKHRLKRYERLLRSDPICEGGGGFKLGGGFTLT